MGPLLCLLLCAAPLLVPGVHSEDDHQDDGSSSRWSTQRLPLVLDRNTELLDAPTFRGRGGARGAGPETGSREGLCGIECQDVLPPLNAAEQERILGYETVYENGTRTQTDVTLRGFDGTPPPRGADAPRTHGTTRSRRKRQVYGTDGRFVISDSQFTTKYPFSAAVRLSTGCSGVLVSPRHVLTAAHCVHDGREYLEGAQRLKVGVLQLKTKRGGRGGRRRGGGGGRKRGERRGETRGEGGAVAEDEEEEANSVDGEGLTERKGGRGGRRRGRSGAEEEEEEVTADGGNADAGDRGGKRRRPKLRRTRRGAEARKQPAFRWSRVKQTHVPKGWIHSEDNRANSVAPDYDYAILELKRPVRQKPMELGVAPASTPLARIHFSGYDAAGAPDDGLVGAENVVYRFCSVMKESDDLMYQQCDAQQGATGAGVYVRLMQEAGDSDRKGKWQRRVIGVYSGSRLVEMEGGEYRDFNVAVRITAPKYAQICHWIHGDPRLCQMV